jgi:hypothetical protein
LFLSRVGELHGIKCRLIEEQIFLVFLGVLITAFVKNTFQGFSQYDDVVYGGIANMRSGWNGIYVRHTSPSVSYTNDDPAGYVPTIRVKLPTNNPPSNMLAGVYYTVAYEGVPTQMGSGTVSFNHWLSYSHQKSGNSQ